MNLTTFSATELAIFAAAGIVMVIALAAFFVYQKRRTEKLRTKFGGAEYARAMEEAGSRRHGEAGLQKRANRVEQFHIRPLASDDRLRFVNSWRDIQARFVDAPAGAVSEADQLLVDVMSTRGYPVSNFEQRAADISVDHPVVLQSYRAAHEIVLRQSRGDATTEELRQAMVHFRTLFEELVNQPEALAAKASA